MRHQAAAPRYFLYGEPDRNAEVGFLHAETIPARARIHGWTIKPHRHADLAQFIFVTAGGGVASIGGSQAAFHASALIVVPPTVVHGFTFEPGTDGFVVTFAVALLAEALGRHERLDALLADPHVLALTPSEVEEHDFGEAFSSIAREVAWNLPWRETSIVARLALLGVALARLLPARRATEDALSAAERLFLDFRTLVEQDFREHRPVTAYAAALGIPPLRLAAVCRRVVGRSPLEILQERLTAEAKRSLLYTSMSVGETAYSLGFKDPAYFSRFFTRRVGESPVGYRARLRDANAAEA